MVYTEATAYSSAHFDQYREATHVPELPDDPTVLDQRTFRLDEPHDTVTVDHIRPSDMWVRGSGFLSNWDTVQRGAAIDQREVRRIATVAAVFEPDFEAYCPTTGDLDMLPKYSRSGFQCWRGADKDRRREGMLPVYLQLKYDGALPEKGLRQIEWEQLQADRRIDARLNSTRGWTR
jgi:hypothetical protein